MSRRIRQGLKEIEKEIADFERSVQNVKASRNKSVDRNSKNDKHLKPFVTEPIRDVVPRVRQKSKTESREIHKQVLENKNATVVITVRTKHSQVRRRSRVNESPRRNIRNVHSVPKESNKYSETFYKETASVNRDGEVKGLPWSSLLNNKKGDYESCSSICSISSQPKNIQSARSTTESKYVYKNNCSTFSRRHDFELKARVDQSVQCPLPQCECGKTDPIGELKSLFTDVLNTLQKNQGKDSNVERNLNKERSYEEEEPVRLSPKSNSGFIPLQPEKSSPADVICAPVPTLPALEEKSDTASSCGSNVVCAPLSIPPTLEEKRDTGSSPADVNPGLILPTLEEKQDMSTPSPGSMHKQLEATNLLLEETYRNIAFKCEEYRKERDQLREEVIQQQKKVQALMEKEKDHLLVINSLQADINSRGKMSQDPCRATCAKGNSSRSSDLEMELQFLRQQSKKYEALMDCKERELARFREELQSIQAVIQEQLENCKFIQCKEPSDEVSFERKGRPVCSSPTSSAVTLGTLESWQRISCISPSTDVGHDSDTDFMLGEKPPSPKHADRFRSTILEATAAISDESVKKMRSELSKVFKEIRNSRLPLPSPPRTYTDLSDSHWTDLSAGTRNEGSLNDSRFTRDADSRFTRDADSRFTRDADSRFTRDADSRFTRDADSRFTRDADSRFTRDADSRFTRDADSRATRGTYSRFTQDAEGRLTRDADGRATRDADSRATRGTYSRFTQDTDGRLTRDAGNRASRGTDVRFSEDTNSRLTQGTNARLTQDADGRLTQDADGRLTQDADGRLTQDADGRLTQDADGRLTQDADGRVTQDDDGRLTQDADGRLTQEANGRLTQEDDSRLAREASSRLTREAGSRGTRNSSRGTRSTDSRRTRSTRKL